MARIPVRLHSLFIAGYCLLLTLPVGATPDETITSAPNDDPEALIGMFDPTLIRGDGNVDLANLLATTSSTMLPGVYVFDVQINGDVIGRRNIRLFTQKGSSRVVPCITLELLAELGIKPSSLEAFAAEPTSTCVDLQQVDPKARADYDSGQMLLSVAIPQAYMATGRRGYVDPSLWDYGVNAGFINYQASIRGNSRRGISTKYYYLGLNNGLNLGGWRLRNESNLTKSNSTSGQFKSNRTYIQHDVSILNGQFSAGELYSNADIFNSVRFKGIQLTSDDAMLADSERGYAPIVRGIAESNATVEVWQNGYLLTSVPVSPGPFSIADIAPSGSNGDLEIIVIEADGRRRSFIQAYASLPLMVKRGTLRYSAELGQYKSTDTNLPTPNFASVTAIYGLTDDLTIAGGMQASSNFQAVNLGVGSNTPIGAVSIDVTNSRSTTAGKTTQGQSVRALYTKTLITTQTTFTLAAYRYSTQGYRTFDNHVYESLQSRDNYYQSRASYRPRSRMDLSINQQLGASGKYGSVYLNSTYENYWNQQRANSISAGYGNTWGRLAYNISYSRSTTRTANTNSYNSNQLMLTLSIPLGTGQGSPQLYTSSVRSKEGTSTTASVTGFVPGTQYTTYSIQGSRSASGNNSGALALNSSLPIAQVGGNYSTGSGYHSYGANASGAMVMHAGGINLTRQVGDSFALVKVEGATGVGLGNNLPTSGSNSYVVYPYTQPYKVNIVRLDPATLDADTELDSLTQMVIPRRGAIVHTSFSGYTGRRVQMRFNYPNGTLPLGAAVTDDNDRQVGLVDNNGQALLLLSQDSGKLSVHWQNGQCEVTYQLPERDPSRYYDRSTQTCMPVPTV
ncbi:MAG: fimbria/pilus outer membrane usher protein [Paenalcaligenes sp.]